MTRSAGIRRGALRGACFVLVAVAAAALPGCYEQKQTAVMNPDGSGKVTIVTRAAVPAVAAPGAGAPGPSAAEFGRQLAKDFINKTQGVEGWSDLVIGQTPDGDAQVTATAYFPDVSKLRFNVPLVFSWQRQEDGTHRFGIERERGPGTPEPLKITDAQLKEQVAQAQARYKEQQPALQTALSAFTLTMTFTLPGEVVETRVMKKEAGGGAGAEGRTVTFAIEGKKLVAALDKFMADEAAIGATIKSGNDLMSNDDLLLEAMYGEKGPVTATVRIPADPPPAFDYPREAKAALAREPQMLKDAGVELVPKFIVGPQTRPR